MIDNQSFNKLINQLTMNIKTFYSLGVSLLWMIKIWGQSDVGIIQLVDLPANVFQNTIQPIVLLKNFGATTLMSAHVHWQLDSLPPLDQQYIGWLGTGQYVHIRCPMELTFRAGRHTLRVYTTLPNEVVDSFPANDTLTQVFTYDTPCDDTYEPNDSPTEAIWIPTDSLINSYQQYNGSDFYRFRTTLQKPHFTLHGRTRRFQLKRFNRATQRFESFRRWETDTTIIMQHQVDSATYLIEVERFTDCYNFKIETYPPVIRDLTIDSVRWIRDPFLTGSGLLRTYVRNAGNFPIERSRISCKTPIMNFINELPSMRPQTTTAADIEIFQYGLSHGIQELKVFTQVPMNWEENIDNHPENDTFKLSVEYRRAPKVQLAQPIQNQIFTNLDTITLKPTITSYAGRSVKQVSFYQDSIWIGTSSQAPYHYSWTQAPYGRHRVTARATDTFNVEQVSDSVAIWVKKAADIGISDLSTPQTRYPSAVTKIPLEWRVTNHGQVPFQHFEVDISIIGTWFKRVSIHLDSALLPQQSVLLRDSVTLHASWARGVFRCYLQARLTEDDLQDNRLQNNISDTLNFVYQDWLDMGLDSLILSETMIYENKLSSNVVLWNHAPVTMMPYDYDIEYRLDGGNFNRLSMDKPTLRPNEMVRLPLPTIENFVYGRHKIAIRVQLYYARDTFPSDNLLESSFYYAAPPTIEWKNASPAQALVGQPIVLEVQARADTGTMLRKVAFYNGNQLINEDSIAPYRYEWAHVNEGRYLLTARAYDDKGRFRTAQGLFLNVLKQKDAAIETWTTYPTNMYADRIPYNFVLQNYGMDSLTEVRIHYQLDARPVQQRIWRGLLRATDFEIVDLDTIRWGRGEHLLTIWLDSTDNHPSNDTLRWHFWSWVTDVAAVQPFQEVKIYPNPAFEAVTIDLDLAGSVDNQLIISDARGRVVWQQLLNPSILPLRIPTVDWEKGIYWLHLRGSTHQVTKRFLISAF